MTKEYRQKKQEKEVSILIVSPIKVGEKIEENPFGIYMGGRTAIERSRKVMPEEADVRNFIQERKRRERFGDNIGEYKIFRAGNIIGRLLIMEFENNENEFFEDIINMLRKYLDFHKYRLKDESIILAYFLL